MGYIDDNLLPGETVCFRARPHGIVLFWPVVAAAAMTVAGVMSVVGAFGGASPTERKILLGMAMIELAIAAVALVTGLVRRSATEMAVTSRRVIAKSGLVKRATLELALEKVESVSVAQELAGRILGYGNIVVRGTGGTNELFYTIAQPLEFRRQVQHQLDVLQHGRTATEPRPGEAGAGAPALYCSRCGAPAAGEGRFCSRCGAPLAG